MRLALQTDYALRTLIFLAIRPGRTNVAAVAEFFQISKDHVAKVVGQLSRLGYVRGIRGIGGGIELAKNAADVSVGEVITAFEGNMHLLECVGTAGVCVIQPGCQLRHVLAEAERIQVDYLNGVRLSDLVAPGGQLVELQSAKFEALNPK
jgi:Rrf2 family nitric oxide-sensitive transcriptional repressor